jgi:hypothetical protein
MRRAGLRVLLLVVALLGGNANAFAQSGRPSVPEIVPDRPDFSESSEVVPAGWLQLESGIRFEGEELLREFSAPAALLRIGLGRGVELRLGAEGFLSESVGDIRHSGRSDMEVGAKIRLLNQSRAGIDLALLPIVSLPTGTAGFTSGGVDTTIKIAWARQLPSGLGLSGNVNLASLTEDGSRFHQQAMSLSLGRDLLFGWGGYVEGFALSKVSAVEGAGVTVNAGIARAIGRQVQIDIEAGRGLSSAAPDWFVGFGIAVLGPQGPRR